MQQVSLLRKDIELGLDKIKASIDNGTALKSSIAVLQVELLKSNQRMIELDASRRAYMEMLGLLINQPVDDNTILIKPAAVSTYPEINRHGKNVMPGMWSPELLTSQIRQTKRKPEIVWKA